MSDFTSDLHNFRPSLSYMNPKMGGAFAGANQEAVTEDSPSTCTFNLMPAVTINNSNNLQTFQIPREYWTGNNIPAAAAGIHNVHYSDQQVHPTFSANSSDCKKRGRAGAQLSAESSSGNSSPQLSQTAGGVTKRKAGCGRGKKAKLENEKGKDVVHVRARRGQATDSHSLAERVRRGKINERLRCLQDIVPGCYKTMGMAVMLDEIINYVQSLQNQVEFLSMKLTAASAYHDFNSETDDMETAQMIRAKVNEAKEMERIVREGYGGLASFNSTNWPF